MNKRLPIILVILALLLSFALFGIADAVGSPTLDSRFIPNKPQGFRVCNDKGKVVDFLPYDQVEIDTADLKQLKESANLLFMFDFYSSYQLKEGWYIEYPIYFRTDGVLKASINDKDAEIELINNPYWILHITEYGTIKVIVKEVD